MPAPVPVAGALKIEFKMGDGSSHEAGSRFFFAYTGAVPNVTDLNTLATDVADTWLTNIGPLVNSAEALHGVIITDLSSDTAAVGTWAGTKNGTSGGSGVVTSAVCVVLNHTIARRYRGGRPRTYIRAGSDSDLLTTNTWTSDFLTAITSGWQAWMAAIEAVSTISITLTNPLNISYISGSTPFTKPSGRVTNLPVYRTTPLKDQITDTVASSRLGTQRRRLNI